MIFFIPLSLLLIGLQFLHARLLFQILPKEWRPWIPKVLIAAHAIFFVYFLGLRPFGLANNWIGQVLKSAARGVFYFQVVTILDLLIWGVASLLWGIHKLWTTQRPSDIEDPARRVFLRKATFGSLGLLAVAGAGGAAQAYGDPEILRRELKFADLPEGLDGLRIVHLSDLHAGPMIGLGQLKRWRQLAERERPDLLIITGDFVDSLPQEFLPFAEAFQDFSAPLGRFAILGNHDYYGDPRPLWEGLEKLGFHCLENRHHVIQRNGAELVLLGLQDPQARSGRFRGVKFGPGPMPQDVAIRLPKAGWRLCLCHRPSNWNLARETGARLTLSGHTHGGQINLGGFSIAKTLGPYIQGIYREQDQTLYVSRGLGVVGLPIRMGAPPEIAVLTLRRQEIPSLLRPENQIT